MFSSKDSYMFQYEILCYTKVKLQKRNSLATVLSLTGSPQKSAAALKARDADTAIPEATPNIGYK